MGLFGLKGKMRQIAVKAGDKKGPTTGKAWLILSGSINHITGTDTIFRAYRRDAVIFWQTMIASANGSALYPMFNAAAIAAASLFQTVIITEDEYFDIQGGAGVLARIKVFEFQIPFED